MNQLTTLLTIYLTTPATDFYITKIIAQSKNPTLEPFKANDINVGSFDFMGQPIGVSLKSLNIVGLSNIQIEKTNGKAKIDVQGDQVTFDAIRPNTEAPPKNIPVDLIIHTELEIVAHGSASPLVPVVVTVTNGTLVGVFNATGDSTNPDTVQITFSSLTLHTDESSSNIRFDLSKLNSFLKPQIDAYLKKTATLTSLVQKMNEQLQSPAVLNAISQGGTQAAQSTLKKLL